MRFTRWTAVVALLALPALAVLALSCATPAPGPAPMTQEQKVARGEYLAEIGGCGDCHTPGTLFGAPDLERHLSGSELGWVGPWGTSYPSNITPDMETGIGSWSEGDIVKALRTGQRADGSMLLPPMPWPALSRMTDEDAYAIAAYLKSVPPIRHKVPERKPPGTPPARTDIVLPEPSAWDAPRTPPGGAAADTARGR